MADAADATAAAGGAAADEQQNEPEQQQQEQQQLPEKKEEKEDAQAAEEDEGPLALADHKEELTAEELNTVRDCESIGGDEEFMLMIIKLLAEGLDEKLDKAFASFPKDDWEGVWRQAHSIKGSSLQCSLDLLGNAAMEVELYFKKVDKEGETPDKALMSKMLKKLAYEARRVQNSTTRLEAEAEAAE